VRRLFLLAGLAAGLVCGLPVESFAQNPIHWSLAITAKGPVKQSEKFDALLTARIDKGWHLYALEEPAGGPIATSIDLSSPKPFAVAGTIGAPPGIRAFDAGFNLETEYFEDEATFVIPVKVLPDTANAVHKLKVTVGWQTCNASFCLPPKEQTLTLDVGVGTTSATSATSAATTGTTSTTGVPAGAATPGVPAASVASGAPAAATGVLVGSVTTPPHVPDMAASEQASTLSAYVGLAALMGALSLLTPCVFPMVPITVSYFTNRARKNRREAVIQALIYGFGIIFTFTGLGFTLAIVFGASGLNRFAADPFLNLLVTAMFIAFAFSLFGVWEMALPSSWLTAASKADSGKSRLVGTLLMGLAFTLTSFTCTAPFLGTLLVVAAQGDWQWPLAGMLAFSSVFALPFVILAIVPQAVASLPRSGPWLLAVKAVMGIVELAAAMKFLSNADLVWGWHIFTREVVLATWVILAIVLVLYLAGLIPLGPVPRLKRPGVARLVAVVGSVALAFWLGSGLMGRRLGELEAFLPPADLASRGPKGELTWIMNDWNAALAQAKTTGLPILIDFTGYTCTNCRWMEANMFPRDDVSRELSRYIRVRLYTDGKGEVYQRFQDMEERMFGTVALPLYAAMTADGSPKVMFGGLTRDPNQYIGFLRKGLQ
jgi:thiol:disulfide interchange protein DsbD